MLTSLRTKILPLVEDACTKIASKDDAVPLGKTVKLESGSFIRVVLTKSQWATLRAQFTLPAVVDRAFAKEGRRVQINNPRCIDSKKNVWYMMWPAYRTCVAKFLDDSILLPFGTSREAFDTPNPTFHQQPNVWPFRDDAHPWAG
jgi:hypothetical protein